MNNTLEFHQIYDLSRKIITEALKPLSYGRHDAVEDPDMKYKCDELAREMSIFEVISMLTSRDL